MCPISNPYPIKWIGLKIQKYGFGFETNPFKLIKSNMDFNNYDLDLAIWIFLPTLTLHRNKIHILVISMCFNYSGKVMEFRMHLQCKKQIL